MTKFQPFICPESTWRTDNKAPGCGHRWNAEVHPVAGYVVSEQVACDFPAIKRTDDFSKAIGVEFSGSFAHLCPNCGSRAQEFGKSITGRIGKTACEQVCETATGGDCRCQCGGTNHGVRS